jgi:glutamate racemase
MAGQDHLPIGVFDSGIGGLTVLRVIHETLPAESTLYLGDTARVPYGTKSPEVVTRYALNNARFLAGRGIKLLVVACNTASAVALPALEEEMGVPVVGVIGPGARRAIRTTRSGVVGVIGTEGTIASGSYERALVKIRPGVSVKKRPCPLFVPLAEEGYIDKKATYLIAQDYLQTMHEVNIDTLILGCTHYPLLKNVIADVMGDEVTLIDSGQETAREAYGILMEKGMINSAASQQPVPEGEHKFFVSDVPEKFTQVASRFLGRPVDRVTRVDISGY